MYYKLKNIFTLSFSECDGLGVFLPEKDTGQPYSPCSKLCSQGLKAAPRALGQCLPHSRLRSFLRMAMNQIQLIALPFQNIRTKPCIYYSQ